MVSTRSSGSSSAPATAPAPTAKRVKATSKSTASSSASTPASTSSKPSQPSLKPTVSAAKRSKFPYDLPYAQLCLRTHPHLYRTGVGEQGVLMVEPYKSELVPHWRFRTPSIATTSSSKLLSIFRCYLDEGDFVGADMARKFIQMGYTRARRYANHKGGKKYIHADDKAPKGRGSERTEIKRLAVDDQDADKVEAASIFKACLDAKVWTNEEYARLREEHLEWSKRQPVLTEDSEAVKSAVLKHPEKEREVRKW